MEMERKVEEEREEKGRKEKEREENLREFELFTYIDAKLQYRVREIGTRSCLDMNGNLEGFPR